MAKSPDAFRTITEVAEWLDTPAHVLRFWESKFTQVRPVKRAGGRRYYRPEDMRLLGGIKALLHDEGLTIKGVQKLLREKGVRHVADLAPPLDDAPPAHPAEAPSARIRDDVEEAELIEVEPEEAPDATILAFPGPAAEGEPAAGEVPPATDEPARAPVDTMGTAPEPDDGAPREPGDAPDPVDHDTGETILADPQEDGPGAPLAGAGSEAVHATDEGAGADPAPPIGEEEAAPLPPAMPVEDFPADPSALPPAAGDETAPGPEPSDAEVAAARTDGDDPSAIDRARDETAEQDDADPRGDDPASAYSAFADAAGADPAFGDAASAGAASADAAGSGAMPEDAAAQAAAAVSPAGAPAGPAPDEQAPDEQAPDEPAPDEPVALDDAAPHQGVPDPIPPRERARRADPVSRLPAGPGPLLGPLLRADPAALRSRADLLGPLLDRLDAALARGA
ncbi:MerR family transcriptional regulator [Wenxinia saemankumensis]|uniref:DNA-binding transcriptional regulator, MerR family n=1 Tax=Wenxinia saemankumensis TaxID=1447782 RepID=A0A1M6A3N9_9RHOB|nr:MerR family transcriptional regulator [Wenxinia saemankumensis]SHI31097.1 DNA-binding transcriptional regulator, MerR family [Wenxinia saemankumensis]